MGLKRVPSVLLDDTVGYANITIQIEYYMPRGNSKASCISMSDPRYHMVISESLKLTTDSYVCLPHLHPLHPPPHPPNVLTANLTLNKSPLLPTNSSKSQFALTYRPPGHSLLSPPNHSSVTPANSGVSTRYPCHSSGSPSASSVCSVPGCTEIANTPSLSLWS